MTLHGPLFDAARTANINRDVTRAMCQADINTSRILATAVGDILELALEAKRAGREPDPVYLQVAYALEELSPLFVHRRIHQALEDGIPE